LIAFNLVILGALITVGAIGTSILNSATALACALPLNVAGIFLLRLIKDTKEIGIDDFLYKLSGRRTFPISRRISLPLRTGKFIPGEDRMLRCSIPSGSLR
jgi:hypothetical protein